MKLQEFIAKNRKWFQWIVAVTVVISWVYFYYQGYLILKTKSRQNVPIVAAWLQLVTSLFWFTYGFGQKDWLIQLSGVLGTVGSIFVIIAYYITPPSKQT